MNPAYRLNGRLFFLVMDHLFHLFYMYRAILGPMALWLFSAAMSTMPDLPANAGFGLTWVYKFLQAIAANFQKHASPQGIAGTDKSVDKTKVV